MLTREHGSKRWDLPGGGVEHREDLIDAFRREINEELGLKVSSFNESGLQAWFMYDEDPGWGRPILYLVARATVEGVPQPDEGVEVGYFEMAELNAVNLEKHVEHFRQKLIRLASGDKT
jgi:8-oxo-dGTP pyrophosphatase MutT (NUDIX family)